MRVWVKKYKDIVYDAKNNTTFYRIDYAGFSWKGKEIIGDGKFAGQQKFTREVKE